MTDTTPMREKEWSTGWPVLAAGFMGVFWMGAAASPLSVLVKPIGETWGWSRGETTFLVSINALVILLLGPLAGRAVRRFGSFRVALVSCPLAALGLYVVGQSGPNLLLWYIGWIFFSIVYLGNNIIVWAAAVTAHFNRHRGLALAVALSGNAAGNAVLPVTTLALYNRFGIDGAFAGLGLLLLASCLPLLLWQFRLQSNRPVAQASTGLALGAGLTLSRAMTGLRFWQLAFGFMVIGAVVGSIAIHFPAIMSDKGISAETAAWTMSLLGPGILVGRFAGGLMLDRCTARQVIVPVFLGPIIACFLLADFQGAQWLAATIVLLAGVAIGAEGDLLAYFVGRYFGRDNFPQIYAAMFGLFGLAFGTSPTLVGFVYDRVGDYGDLYRAFGGVLVLGVLSLLLLGDYPDEKAVSKGDVADQDQPVDVVHLSGSASDRNG